MAKGKRRRFSAEFKAQVALDALRGRKSQAALCREHNLNPDVVTRWRQQLEENAVGAFRDGRAGDDEQVLIAELQQMIGQLTMELKASKKVSQLLSYRSQGSER
jgi:transposase